MADVVVKIDFPFGDIVQLQEIIHHLKHVNRFSLPDKLEKFVEGLIKYGNNNCAITLRAGTEIFRARANSKGIKGVPLKTTEMGPPPGILATSGRINPEGIPYLYCANNEVTAIAEIRPYVGSEVTIASIKLNKDVRCLDLTKAVNPKDRVFWTELFVYSFSWAISPDDKLNYVPTQYFAEKFKASGFEAIQWQSGQTSGGINSALFVLDKHDIISTRLVKINGVNYTY